MTAVAPAAPGREGSRQAELLLHIVGQQFRSKYRRARFGWAWALIQPLLFLLIYVFVFARLHDFGVENYALYVYLGITVMSLSQQGTMAAAVAPTQRGDLLLLPGFERRLIPVAALLNSLIDFALSLPVLVVFLLLGPGLHPTMPLLIIPLTLQMVLVLGLAYLFGTVNVFVRDVQILLSTALTLWFFVTPTFWSEDRIPEAYRWVLDFNVAAAILDSYRAVVMHGELPDWGRLVPAVFVAIDVFVIGWIVYGRWSPRFADEL